MKTDFQNYFCHQINTSKELDNFDRLKLEFFFRCRDLETKVLRTLKDGKMGDLEWTACYEEKRQEYCTIVGKAQRLIGHLDEIILIWFQETSRK